MLTNIKKNKKHSYQIYDFKYRLVNDYCTNRNRETIINLKYVISPNLYMSFYGKMFVHRM